MKNHIFSKKRTKINKNTHLEISALNTLAPLNIECMETAEDTSHLFVKTKKQKCKE